MIVQTVEWREIDFDLWPSLCEVARAERAFMSRLEKDKNEVRTGNMELETAIRCALAEVWRQGRLWQRDRANEEKAHPQTTRGRRA